jgi:TetR/AcrR family transcriptional regulator, tetracycline repressor protein
MAKRRGKSNEKLALNRERVLAAALQVLDRDAVDGLTMRALGRELDVDPMAVYHYFPNKAAVLDGLVEAVWAELELPSLTDEAWQIQLERIAAAVRRTLLRHPHALPVMATRPNRSIQGFRLTDRTLGVLRLAGLPPLEALEVVNAAGEFLLGHALAEAGVPQLTEGAADDHAILTAFEDASTREAFPHLAEAFACGVTLSAISMDRIFDAGIAALRRGIEKRIDGLDR